MISAKPNTPMATTAKPMPSDSSGMSNAMRDCAGFDVGADHRQQQAQQHHGERLEDRALASTTAKHRPSTISEKYSAGPNSSAIEVSGAPSAATSTVETQPAKNEPIAAMASAGPARPWRAIWWPSSVVTTEDDSPGMLIRIEVVEPPYCAP